MITPGRSILILAVVNAFLLFGALAAPQLLFVAIVVDVALVGLTLLEGAALRKQSVTVERVDWTRLEINRTSFLKYRITNPGSTAVSVRIEQDWPSEFEAEENELNLRIAPGEKVMAQLAVTPLKRGHFTIAPMQLQLSFMSHLSRFRRPEGEEFTVCVYPDLSAVSEYERLRRHRALSQFGIHRMRMIGAGREFDQLREYQPDDDYSDINWKATARRREPITNVYQAERAQDVMICIDKGRMMGNPIGNGVALDRAVDAAMMLTHVCNRSGDRTGLAVFGDTVTDYLKPLGGRAAATRIVDHLVNIQPDPIFPSFAELVSALRINQNRRSMVFVFTDLNDPQLAKNMADTIPLISRRHVCVIVSLRDSLLERVAAGPAHSYKAVCQVLAARQLADERTTRTRELIKTGVQVLECDVDRISIDVINEYLTLKMRQMV